MTILLAVDGTGPDSAQQYATEFRDSFVHRIFFQSPAREKSWSRGPTAAGNECLGMAQRSHRWLREHRRDDEEVLLTGYSRGAAIVVCVARLLQEDGVGVRAMMLFDCVDMAIDIDAAAIPTNVTDVLHVQRHPDAESRWWWGNDGVSAQEPPTTYRQRRFRGTHGALGGVPQTGGAPGDTVWEELDPTNVTYSQNERVSRDVWNWVVPYLRRQGFLPR